MKRLLFWLVTAIGLQGLAACAIQGDSPSAESASANTSITTSGTALSAYHWQLQPDFDTKRDPVQLTFRDQRLSVTGLCNNMGASYSTDGQKMTIKQVVSTMRMCNDEALMTYEQKVGIQLEKVATWTIAGTDTQASPTLTLNFTDGTQWVLNGKQTNEAKYGASETVFLEIQPKVAACNHPLIADKQCLKVRTLTYDSSGLKQGIGEWQLFYDNIEGYTHEAGIRNVLRLKRYTRANPPADASRYVYVLDMVVESERVPG